MVLINHEVGVSMRASLRALGARLGRGIRDTSTRYIMAQLAGRANTDENFFRKIMNSKDLPEEEFKSALRAYTWSRVRFGNKELRSALVASFGLDVVHGRAAVVYRTASDSLTLENDGLDSGVELFEFCLLEEARRRGVPNLPEHDGLPVHLAERRQRASECNFDIKRWRYEDVPNCKDATYIALVDGEVLPEDLPCEARYYVVGSGISPFCLKELVSVSAACGAYLAVHFDSVTASAAKVAKMMNRIPGGVLDGDHLVYRSGSLPAPLAKAIDDPDLVEEVGGWVRRNFELGHIRANDEKLRVVGSKDVGGPAVFRQRAVAPEKCRTDVRLLSRAHSYPPSNFPDSVKTRIWEALMGIEQVTPDPHVELSHKVRAASMAVLADFRKITLYDGVSALQEASGLDTEQAISFILANRAHAGLSQPPFIGADGFATAAYHGELDRVRRLLGWDSL